MEKIVTTKMIDTLDIDLIFNGSIQEVSNEILKLNRYSKEGWTNINLKVDYSSGGDYTSIELWGDRIETDAEYTARMKKIEKNNAAILKEIKRTEAKLKKLKEELK